MNVKPDFSKGKNYAETAPAFLSVWEMQSYYGESYIVQGINFNVHEGEILALLGRNGAGKTTTLRSIARMDSPQVNHGEIWLDHQPLHNMKSHQAAAAGIGLVPEDRCIIPGLTVEETRRVMKISRHPISIDRPVGESEDSQFGHFIEDIDSEAPQETASSDMLRSRIADVLKTLTYREREILKLRYGIGDGYTYTLEEVGRIFKVTRERVRQVESKAIRKLQHPVRKRRLANFLATTAEEAT